MNTIEPMVVPSPLGWEPLPAQPQRRWRWLGLGVLLLVGALIGSVTVELPYYSLAPGSARQVNDLIGAPTANSHPPKGKFLLTTVSLRHATALDALIGWIDDDTDVVEEDVIVPPETSGDDYRKLNLQLMDDSKQTAIVVALRRLGHPVAEKGQGALVVEVAEGLPAAGRLSPGDVIVAVDGAPTTLSGEAVRAIRAKKPGDVVAIEVAAPEGGGNRTERLTLAANPSGSGAPVLGVQLRTNKQEYDLPFDVNIRSGSIGGPSAGLAFTLGIIDTLTPGELTGGGDVAVTGTIDADGMVGDVGGVTQKTAAVRRSGAKLFLVPPGEYETARAHAGPGVDVVRVASLEDALTALERHGGDMSGLRAG